MISFFAERRKFQSTDVIIPMKIMKEVIIDHVRMLF
jgi:hypothetical protein